MASLVTQDILISKEKLDGVKDKAERWKRILFDGRWQPAILCRRWSLLTSRGNRFR